MHLRNVEIFCEVAARRSFSKAAHAHDVSQSLASQAVHSLEKRLGVQLIDRSKRPLELTRAGQLYYEGCRDLLEAFRNIEDRVQQTQNRVAGRVRAAAIYSVGLLQMDAYVRRFQELYPEAELLLDYLHPDEVYARIVHDEADIGLVSFPRDGGELSSIPWQEQEMALVVSPTHPLADREGISIKEIEGEQYVGFTSELTIRKRIDRWLRRATVAVHVVHEFDNIETIKRAVEIGAGVAVLPVPTVLREAEAGSLCVVRLEDVSWTRPLGIVHKRHKTLTTAAEKFVELLHQDPETFPHNGRGSYRGNGQQPGTSKELPPTRGARPRRSTI